MPRLNDPYPATVAEVLDDHATFKPDALRAVKALARSKPWQGSPAERMAKLDACLAALSAAYGIRKPRLEAGDRDCYWPAGNTIWLTEQLSVVTFLHEFGHARGFNERQTCRWSINIFRRCFPRSYAACEHDRHTLRRRQS